MLVRVSRTRCEECQGATMWCQPRCRADPDGWLGTEHEPRKCETCEGLGWVPGFVIPC